MFMQTIISLLNFILFLYEILLNWVTLNPIQTIL